ncbi:flagellar biosynthesis protein FlhA, partial [Pseudoalteromonas sp. S1649]
MGLVPGMPHIEFLRIRGYRGYLAYITQEHTAKAEADNAEQEANGGAPGSGVANKHYHKDLGWDDGDDVAVIVLEVGYLLIPLVVQSQVCEE